MRIYHLLFPLLFACQLSLLANNPTGTLRMPHIAFEKEMSCNLPSPSSLDIVNVGPGWVEVSWSAVPGAAQYRLQSFDASTGMELSAPLFVSATASSAVVSTDGNSGSAFVRIWSVCENGEYPTNNYTQSASFDDIVIEVVASGITVFPSNYTPVPVTTTGVPISWTGSDNYFIVNYSNGGRKFVVRVKDFENPDIVVVNPGIAVSDQAKRMVFAVNETQSTLLIKYKSDPNMDDSQAVLVASLTASVNPSTGQGTFRKISGEAVVNKAVPFAPFSSTEDVSEGNTPDLTERNSLFSEAGLSVNPNPFSDRITVQLQNAQNPNGTVMHLYDLLGARRMSYQLPANQTACSLNTSQLEPGVYFLHLETDGHLQTIKLIKTL